MSNVIYQSDKVLIRKCFAPKQVNPGLEIFTQKEDIAGNRYFEWAGMLESSSNYCSVILNLVDRLQQNDFLIENLKLQIKNLEDLNSGKR